MRRLARASLCLCSLACGPSAGTSDGDDDGDAGESSTGDTVPDPPPTSCVSSPQLGNDPFATEQSCVTYYGELDPPSITVRIVNRTSATLVLASSTGGPRSEPRHFAVDGSMGGRHFASTASGCAENWNGCVFWSDSPPGGCELIGIFHPSIVLAPGGWYEQTWSAWTVTEVMLPSSCFDTDEREVVCGAPVDVASGTWQLRADAGVLASATECCTPDEQGSCETPPDSCERDPTLTAVASYDGQCDSVELAFTE